MSTEHLGTTTASIDDAPDDAGVELPLDDEVTDILGLEPGDEVGVEVRAQPDGDLSIHVDLADADEITPDQKQALIDALETSPGTAE